MTDWNEKTLAYWETINKMAIRRFGETVLAEEAALAVIDGLKADNWSRVRAYNEQATFATFLRTLTFRLLEDFSRKRFGRVRPPSWVKNLGGIWKKLFSALCLERLPVAEAVEIVFHRDMITGKSEIEAAAYQLLARLPDCGMHQGLEVAYDEENFSKAGYEKSIPESAIEERQKKGLFAAIFQLVLGEQKEIEISTTLLEKYEQLRITLSPEEKLLLKLCYQDGFGVVKAGKMLGMSRFQVHGKKRRLMARLKLEFDRTGLAEELRRLLDMQ